VDQGRVDRPRAPALVSHHSRHRIWEVNVDFGFPAGLSALDFRAIILHYSVFGMGPYRLGDEWLAYLDQSEAYKIAFFQDEYTRCQPCFKFLNDHRIDCVYTCLEPSEFHKVYGRYTGVPKLVSNLPGYVSTAILEAGRRFSMPLGRRTVDVGTAVARSRPSWVEARWRNTGSASASASWRVTAVSGWISQRARATACTGTRGRSSWRTAAVCSA
jgi:hypothetical protein